MSKLITFKRPLVPTPFPNSRGWFEAADLAKRKGTRLATIFELFEHAKEDWAAVHSFTSQWVVYRGIRCNLSIKKGEDFSDSQGYKNPMHVSAEDIEKFGMFAGLESGRILYLIEPQGFEMLSTAKVYLHPREAISINVDQSRDFWGYRDVSYYFNMKDGTLTCLHTGEWEKENKALRLIIPNTENTINSTRIEKKVLSLGSDYSHVFPGVTFEQEETTEDKPLDVSLVVDTKTPNEAPSNLTRLRDLLSLANPNPTLFDLANLRMGAAHFARFVKEAPQRPPQEVLSDLAEFARKTTIRALDFCEPQIVRNMQVAREALERLQKRRD